MSQNGEIDQVAWLQSELQDAHLVIGQQQVRLLRLEQANANLSQQIRELQQQQDEPALVE